MTDYMIIGVLALILFFAVITVAKRTKSKSSCCGSGTYVAKSRKLKTVAEKRTFQVEGMHCQHCVNRVMSDVQDIPHVSASVNLKKGMVTVSMEKKVDDAVIIAAIEKGGYKVI